MYREAWRLEREFFYDPNLHGLDPKIVRQGKDPQLEKAIAIVMEELAKNPLPKPKRPAYPNYHKKNNLDYS